MSTRIQLRGISRTPSDKMAADGGLAESLNIRLDNDECAPMIPPKDLTNSASSFSSYGLPPVSAGKEYNILYLHKQNDYQNYICSQTSGSTTTVGTWQKVGDVYSINAFLTLTGGETIKDVTAVGNTLVIYTDKYPYFVIYKENAYTLLGSRIPAPQIRINAYGNGHTRELVESNYYLTQGNNPKIDNPKGWVIYRLAEDETVPKTKEQLQTLVKLYKSDIKTWVKGLLDKAIENQAISAPVFLRTAVRLFDGTFVNHSAPYCVGAGQEYSTDIWVYERQYEGDDPGDEEPEDLYAYYLCIRINPTSPKVFLNNKVELEQWGDIIRSVDVFASEQVVNPVIATTGETVTEVDRLADAIEFDYKKEYNVIMEGQYVDLAEIEELALKQNVFKLVLIGSQRQSIYDEDYGTTWTDMATSDGVVIPYPTPEVLYNRESLADDYDSNFATIGENSLVFNQRVILSGVKQRLSSGNTWLGAPVASSYMNGQYSSYKFKYFVTPSSADSLDRILAGGDASSVIGKSYAGTDTFTTIEVSTYHREACFGWLAYPHPNCKRAIVRAASGSTKFIDVEMKQHPKLSCSYAFFGFGVELGSLDAMAGMTDTVFNQENPYLSYANKMFYSEAGNPFIFPVENRQTFDGEVIACKVANRPMSTSQFGQFDLYVFTKNGIWSMTTTRVGTFNPPSPVSGDVALSAKAIQSMENSVVFTTSKGVMLIVGSEVSCLSTEMNGKHYTIDSAVVSLLNVSGCPWQKFIPILSDSTPFMEFMKNARFAYDYAGNRILCFNEEEEYAYVYMLRSKTWHKISLPDGTLFSNVVNGFPATSISFASKEVIWRLEAIPSDESKRVAVASALVDNVDVERTQAEWIALLAAGDVDIYENDIIDEDTLASDLYDYQEDYTIVSPTHLLDYATYLEAESSTNLYGVMVTRPMDLDAPDVRKVIKDIRLRGKFNKNDVSYILLGSMDGLNYGVLSSLRGASCKSFRLVLLTKLAQAERLSYVEVEYGERFRNRLR